jgi:preprotein translocase subunit SecE
MSEAIKQKGFGNFSQRIKKFFKELKSEIKKIVWPSKVQVVNNTGVVIAAVLLIGGFIWILDFVLRYIFGIVA